MGTDKKGRDTKGKKETKIITAKRQKGMKKVVKTFSLFSFLTGVLQ